MRQGFIRENGFNRVRTMSVDPNPQELGRLQARPTVTGTQFQLPQFLAEEIAFQSDRLTVTSGALVAWYYHNEREKAILSNADLDHPQLEYVSSCSLSGVSNQDIESGCVTSGKVTISAELPDHIYEPLIAAEKVVLRVALFQQSADEVIPFASVYPATAFDSGEPVDMRSEFVHEDSQSENGSTEDSKVVGMSSKFVNSI